MDFSFQGCRDLEIRFKNNVLRRFMGLGGQNLYTSRKPAQKPASLRSNDPASDANSVNPG
jgi:hypothetical protein